MSINYVRILRKAKCKKCDYHGYDSEFENYIIDKVSVESNQFQVYISIVCPKCNKKDTMIILNP